MGTNVRLPNIHKILPEVDFESSKSPANVEYCRESLVWQMYEFNRAIVWWLIEPSLFTDQRLSGLPRQFVSVVLTLLQLIQVPLS